MNACHGLRTVCGVFLSALLATASGCGSSLRSVGGKTGGPVDPKRDYRLLWAAADDRGGTEATRADAPGGCDGVKNGKFGFHTDLETSPWWQVDLGRVVPIDRVVVFNRTDTAWAPGYATALELYCSDDGSDFEKVYTHDGSVFYGFTDGKPLVIRLGGRSARFVRVQIGHITCLHLDEVEVYSTAEAAKNIALHRPADQSSAYPREGFGPFKSGPERIHWAREGQVELTMQPGRVVVQTDKTRREAPLASQTVRVTAVGPAETPLAETTAPRGKSVTFETGNWPDGPYEIRLAMDSPDGEAHVKCLQGYKGDWRKQAGELLSACDALPERPAEPKDLRLQLLGQIVLDRLGGDPRKASAAAEPEGWRKVFEALMEHREILGGRIGQFHRLAWRDDVDDSPQFACVFLPPDYDGKKPWPLVVGLHGRRAERPYIRWNEAASRTATLPGRLGVILLTPHGRGNASYRGIGERDVLHAIRLTREAFHVDADRIYLTGSSMGGYGSWHLGSRHPDLFAAVAPTCSGGDYRIGISPQEYAALTPRQRFDRESWSCFAQAEALLTTPIFVNHGVLDSVISVEHARFSVGMLQQWGYNVRYREHPSGGHSGLSAEDEIARWALQYHLNRAPRQVRLRSARLESARAHWVQVLQRGDPFAFILAEAEVLRDNTIRLQTKNALQVRLSPGPALVDPARPVRIVWNGRDAGPYNLGPDGVVLSAEGYAPGPLVKKAGVEGPIEDVTTGPFAIVVGTASKDPLMRAMCRRRAQAQRDAWRQWQHVDPRFFLDTEVGDEQIARYSLLLFGGPDENLITRKLIRDIPLSLSPGLIRIAGRGFPVKDAGVVMVYPNPRNPDRYVCITGGQSPAGMFFTDRCRDDRDFAIIDARGPVGSGCFDHNWAVREEYLDAPDPAERSDTPGKAPTRVSAVTADKTLPLAELLEAESAGAFRYMRRARNWEGKPIRLGGKTYATGLGAQAWDEPSTVTYDLAGGEWKRLRATIGIEPAAKEKAPQAARDATAIVFLVRGDGKELYRSPAVAYDARPLTIDVDILGVKRLQLEVVNAKGPRHAAASVDWANARLER